MVPNEILITLTLYKCTLKIGQHTRCWFLIMGEGSDEHACTHNFTRVFASRTSKVCKLKKTPNNFKTSSPSGHSRLSDYLRLLRVCDKTISIVCMPFSHNPDT